MLRLPVRQNNETHRTTLWGGSGWLPPMAREPSLGSAAAAAIAMVGCGTYFEWGGIFASLKMTCLRATGSYFFSSIFCGVVRLFFVV